MERVVITILPPPPNEGLLPVVDAMQQVLDAVALLKMADRALAVPGQEFEWRLEQATTNSPLTVTAVAVPKNPNLDIDPHARRVKALMASGIATLVDNHEPSWWMDAEAIETAQSLFSRNLKGIWQTNIVLDSANGEILIDRNMASAGVRAISAVNAFDAAKDIGARIAWGEIEGVMVAVGRYMKRPAIQIFSELYRSVWCTLPQSLVARFGGEHKMADVWQGQSLGIRGRLVYADGGKLKRIEAQEIRQVHAAPLVNLNDVLDPEFTAGLDPAEYLRKLHDGEIP